MQRNCNIATEKNPRKKVSRFRKNISEAYSEHCQTSNVERFAKINFRKTLHLKCLTKIYFPKKVLSKLFARFITQLTFGSKSTIEILEKGVEYVQS